MISSIKVTKLGIKLDKEFENLKHLLPEEKEQVRFKFNGLVSIINAVRRTIIEELHIPYLTCDLSDIKTNQNVTSDWIHNRIELIPIKPINNLTAELNITNDTDTERMIYTKDLIFKQGGNNIPTANVCDEYIHIMPLDPHNSITIKNIHTVTEEVYKNLKCSIASNIRYVIEGNSTDYTVDRTVEFGFDTNGNYCAKDILLMTCDNLINRVQKILDFLSDITNNESKYTNDINIVFSNEITLTVSEEDYTIGNLFSTHMYRQDPSIPLVVARGVHPTDRTMELIWKHPSGIKIAQSAGITIIKNIQGMKKEFEKIK